MDGRRGPQRRPQGRSGQSRRPRPSDPCVREPDAAGAGTGYRRDVSGGWGRVSQCVRLERRQRRRLTMARRVAVAWALALAIATTANAQSGPSGTSPAQSTTTTQTQSSSTETETRPATTTFFGDTGLWFVPTGEVLPHGKWSASVYRRGTNWIQGYTNVADFAGTFGVGIKNRAEIFGSFLVDTRIDRDVRPIFVNDPSFGSFIDRYPRVNRVWTGD